MNNDILTPGVIFAPVYLTFKNEIKKLLHVSNEETPYTRIKMYKYPDYTAFETAYDNLSIHRKENLAVVKDFMIHKFNDNRTPQCKLNSMWALSNDMLKEQLNNWCPVKEKGMEKKFIEEHVINPKEAEMHYRIKYLKQLKSYLRDNCFIKFVKKDLKINQQSISFDNSFRFTPLYNPIPNVREEDNINAFIVKTIYLGKVPFDGTLGLNELNSILMGAEAKGHLDDIKRCACNQKRKDIYLTDILTDTKGIAYNCVKNFNTTETERETRAQYEFMIELINELYSTIILHNIKQDPSKAREYIKSANKLFRRLFAVKAELINKMDSNFYLDRLPNPFFYLDRLPNPFRKKGGKKETKPKVKKETKPKVKKPTKPKVKKPTKSKVKKETKPKVKKPTKPKVKKPTKSTKTTKPKVKKPTKPKVNK